MSGRRAQRLRQHREVLDADRQLAAARHEHHAVDPDDVAEVELEQQVHPLLAEQVALGLQLDAPRAVVEVQERHPALAAARMQAPGEPVARLGLRPRLEPLVLRTHARDRLDALERVRERVDPLLAQAIELGPPLGEEVIRHRAETLEADVDLGDLELALLAVGQHDRDLFAALVAHQRLADRGLVGELAAPPGWPRPSRRS